MHQTESFICIVQYCATLVISDTQPFPSSIKIKGKQVDIKQRA